MVDDGNEFEKMWMKYKKTLIDKGLYYDKEKDDWVNPSNGIRKTNFQVFKVFCEWAKNRGYIRSQLYQNHLDCKLLKNLIEHRREYPNFTNYTKNDNNTIGYLATLLLPRVGLKSQKWVRQNSKSTINIQDPVSNKPSQVILLKDYAVLSTNNELWVRNSVFKCFETFSELEQVYKHQFPDSDFWTERRTIEI